jgi:hypothetical protein
MHGMRSHFPLDILHFGHIGKEVRAYGWKGSLVAGGMRDMHSNSVSEGRFAEWLFRLLAILESFRCVLEIIYGRSVN